MADEEMTTMAFHFGRRDQDAQREEQSATVWKGDSGGGYEGDYGCSVGVDEETKCSRTAEQIWREPFTPGKFVLMACGEHAEGLRAGGYHFDAEATAQLKADVEREGKEDRAED